MQLIIEFKKIEERFSVADLDQTKRKCKATEIKNVKLMDATGRTVLEKNFNSTEVDLDVSNLQPSVYFINITTNNSIHSTKIIVE